MGSLQSIADDMLLKTQIILNIMPNLKGALRRTLDTRSKKKEEKHKEKETLKNKRCEQLFEQAQDYFKYEKFDLALEDALESLKIFKKLREKPIDYFDLIGLIIGLKFQNREFKESISYCKEAIKFFNKNPSENIYLKLGVTYDCLGMNEKVIEDNKNTRNYHHVMTIWNEAIELFRKHFLETKDKDAIDHETKVLYQLRKLSSVIGNGRKEVECIERILTIDATFKPDTSDSLFDNIKKTLVSEKDGDREDSSPIDSKHQSVRSENDIKQSYFERKVDNAKKITTNSGIKVQSKGEQKIADFLHKNNIEFSYDKQITLRSAEYGNRWVRPDFNLNEKNIIIEYWGMHGDPDYDVNGEKKKRIYIEANRCFISIYPKDLDNLEDILIQKLGRAGISIRKVLRRNSKISVSSIKRRKAYRKKSGSQSYFCVGCGRRIRHKGRCLPCNVKKKHHL